MKILFWKFMLSMNTRNKMSLFLSTRKMITQMQNAQMKYANRLLKTQNLQT